MSAESRAVERRPASLELDVLRGFAALFMIVNHAGFSWLSERDATTSLSGAVVFIGGFAPVVFYFVTGFGAGLSAAKRGRPSGLKSLLLKAGLLAVADQFFAWSQGRGWGLDFFGFIAISVLVVGAVSRLPRSDLICGLLALCVLVARYVIGPVLSRHVAGNGVLEWALGVNPVTNVSYPLAPWLAYPLLGYMLGRNYVRIRSERSARFARWTKASVVVTGLLLGAAASMAMNGLVLFRWGTVSAAYFVLSCGALLATAQLSLWLTSWFPPIAKALALPGTASFALIPLHSLLIGGLVVALSAWLPLSPGVFAVLAILAAVVSFTGSGAFVNAMESRAVVQQRSWLAPLCMAFVAAVALAAIRSDGRSSVVAMSQVFLGQIAIAGLLAMRASGPSTASAVVAQ